MDSAAKKNLTEIILIFLGVVFVAAFLVLFYALPQANIGPEQPIPFSHNVHAGVKQIQCQYCHPYVGYSNFPGIPPVEKCLHCHEYIIAKHPEIQKEHAYFNTKSSTPWVKVNVVPEHVVFNHQCHINAGVDCEECHGKVADLQRLPWKTWRMQGCIECHRSLDAIVDCWLACHN